MGTKEKSLQEKLKVFFKKSSVPVPARNELTVTAELERELAADTPLHRRLRAVRDITEKATVVRIQEGEVQKLWRATRDLVLGGGGGGGGGGGTEARHAALALLCALAEGQADQLQMMRTVYFMFLRDSHRDHAPEDAALRFKLLHTLTNSGKNINCFEEQIGPFILEWLPEIEEPALLVDFLQLVTNMVKFNAAYLDEPVVHGIVDAACGVCTYGACGAGVAGSLALLEAVVSYSLVPRAALPALVAALCRAVNVDAYCQTSWKLMRDVLGADIGHAALLEMLRLLRAPPPEEAGLLRGAVFYVNMGLWGPRRVPALRVSFLAVLPAYLRALRTAPPVLTYEVLVGLAAGVERAPGDLTPPAADLLLEVLAAVVERDRSYRPRNEAIHSRLHALLTTVEGMWDEGTFEGDEDALLDLLDSCGHDRPEQSSMRLVERRLRALSPHVAGWLGAAHAVFDKYLRREPRAAVRLHALEQLRAFLLAHAPAYGSEVMEGVGAAALAACAVHPHAALRAAAARVLAALALAAPPDLAGDLVDLLERILNRVYGAPGAADTEASAAEADAAAAAAAALVRVLCARALLPPGALPLRALLVLLDHLELHYSRRAPLHRHPHVRLQILEMLFGLRANAFNCVGFCYSAAGEAELGAGAGGLRGRPACSPHLQVEGCAARGQCEGRAPPAAGVCLLPAGRVAHAVTRCLTRELDWRVLGAVLRALPALLAARAVAAGRRAQDMDLRAATLCAMLSDRSLNYPECLDAPRPLASEFHAAVLPALAALAPYHAYLEPQTAQRAVRCLLKYGMVLRAAAPHIAALTLFTLEMRDTMVRMLPEVLLDLSKISDTQAIAGPMLEFLSTLTRLPKVFASFVEDQYMSVFAILLPYTNPSRYNHYIVSLAHHVIAAWFLKCRLPYRANFVRFIIHGLHNYILVPFEEQLQHRGNTFQQQALNEDSSNRQRSSSLGSRAAPRVPAGGAGGAGSAGSASAAFHVELTETCVDLLARYTSTPCSVTSARSDTAEFLFEGGQAMTWLVGHKLVTVTTAGCRQNSVRRGMCERCAALCRRHEEVMAAPLPPLAPPPGVDVESLLARAAALGAARHEAALLGDAPQLHVTDGDVTSDLAQHAEVKRYSKHSLQHSRSTDTSSSLSCGEGPSGTSTRQNSSENSRAAEPSLDALNDFAQRIDRISREVEGEERRWAGAGAGPCWAGAWAEVHVRSPTGDVRWLMRVQNQLGREPAPDTALEDVAALLAPPPPAHGAARHERPAGGDERSRELHKSSSDSVVTDERRAPPAAPCPGAPPPRMSTQPINIPGSPQRQSTSSDDTDIMLIMQEGKSRQPVRRSNSSPEMSSSWKGARHDDADMILLPPCAPPPTHKKGGNKKSDTRVSCEAIPEEMSGTSPHHHQLLTFNSDPGTAAAATSTATSAATTVDATAATTVDVGAATTVDTTAATTVDTTAATTVDTGAATSTATQLEDQNTHHQLQKTASDGVVSETRRPPSGARGGTGAGGGKERDDLPPLARSKRSNTISVMSPTRRYRPAPSVANPPPSAAGATSGSGGGGGGGGGGSGGGVTPAFVFLQLYHNMSTSPLTPAVPGGAGGLGAPSQRPLLVAGEQHARSVKHLDLVPPLETYKVGVLYVGRGQAADERAVLRNTGGSPRYCDFVAGLGARVPLDGRERPAFLNLERGGRDGLYATVWQDDRMQVLFHVATAMPPRPEDPDCNEKRKYIGNDFVSIVYNDSGEDFDIRTIKGQLNFCIVVVEPLEHGVNSVALKTKEERIRGEFLAHVEPAVVSDEQAAPLARQLALHAALAAHICVSLRVEREPYAGNALERLRLIKRLRRRLEAERAAHQARAPKPYAPPAAAHRRIAIDDFNDYT